MCTSVREGGLCQEVGIFNKALLCKLLWAFVAKGDGLWRKVVALKIQERTGGVDLVRGKVVL